VILGKLAVSNGLTARCPLASGKEEKEGEADVALDLFGGGDEWECVVSFTDIWSIHCHIWK